MPGSYAPVLRIDLRKLPHGGPPLAAVIEVWAGGNSIVQRHLIVLLHGFNNDLSEAEGSYEAFRRRDLSRLTPPQYDALSKLLGDAFWPGDADWGVADKADALIYPDAVQVAKTIAPMIATYLHRRTGLLEVHFLAHSLGCRVALEVIENLSLQVGSPRIGKVCLMAAAVPTFMVEPGSRLYAALQMPQQVRVLYSQADITLRWAFRAGQTLAGPGEGFFPYALGYSGDVPATPGRIDTRSIPRADHGSYWGKNDDAPSREAGRQVREFFSFADLPERTLPARKLGAIAPAHRAVAHVRRAAGR